MIKLDPRRCRYFRFVKQADETYAIVELPPPRDWLDLEPPPRTVLKPVLEAHPTSWRV